MSVKIILVFCAQALLIKSVFTQSLNKPGTPNLNLGGIGGGLSSPSGGLGIGPGGLGLGSPGISPMYPSQPPNLNLGGIGGGLSIPPGGLSTGSGSFGIGSGGFGLGSGLSTGSGGLGLGSGGLCLGCGCGGGFSGGTFQVTSYSPIAPTGITVRSENSFEGKLDLAGTIPFLGTAAVEGELPTSGSGSISYVCGNSDVGITSEGQISPDSPGSSGPSALSSFSSSVGTGTSGLGSGW